MSDSTKVALISALNTFVATFIATIGVSFATDSVQWTVAIWLALAGAAARAGVKAVIEQFVPARLGGKK